MIRRLPPQVIREIAAGEVVSSPRDVLRELLENALDAGATRLEVVIKEGGKAGILVRDNGRGISKEELPLAVEAHCTSKLTDLGRITTLGFRGEGLYAVRHAASLRLTSRPAGQLGGATLLAAGEEVSLGEHPAPTGTTAEVTELFARLPPRRAALGSAAREGRACLALLYRYLLHHPDLHLGLRIDGEERWHYAGGDHQQAAHFLWGAVTANRLLPLQRNKGSWQLTGLISRPELSRPRRDRLSLGINGRPVAWPDALLEALLRVYLEFLPGRHYPVGILDLTLPYGEVLVNTSPDKRTVRLLRESEVTSFVEETLRETLASHPLAPPLTQLRPPEGVHAAPRHRFPTLRHLGSYRELYLLAEGNGHLWVIDQHAAHERILFEELSRRYRDEPSQELEQAELLELSLEEAEHYRERQAALTERGLMLEPFGGSRWRVRRVPAFLVGFPELVAETVRGSLGGQGIEEAWRQVLGQLACRPAVKAGHHLAAADAQTLLDALVRCRTPWVCPHGRPTALVLTELELARRFGRRGVRAVAPAEQKV